MILAGWFWRNLRPVCDDPLVKPVNPFEPLICWSRLLGRTMICCPVVSVPFLTFKGEGLTTIFFTFMFLAISIIMSQFFGGRGHKIAAQMCSLQYKRKK